MKKNHTSLFFNFMYPSSLSSPPSKIENFLTQSKLDDMFLIVFNKLVIEQKLVLIDLCEKYNALYSIKCFVSYDKCKNQTEMSEPSFSTINNFILNEIYLNLNVGTGKTLTCLAFAAYVNTNRRNHDKTTTRYFIQGPNEREIINSARGHENVIGGEINKHRIVIFVKSFLCLIKFEYHACSNQHTCLSEHTGCCWLDTKSNDCKNFLFAQFRDVIMQILNNYFKTNKCSTDVGTWYSSVCSLKNTCAFYFASGSFKKLDAIISYCRGNLPETMIKKLYTRLKTIYELTHAGKTAAKKSQQCFDDFYFKHFSVDFLKKNTVKFFSSKTHSAPVRSLREHDEELPVGISPSQVCNNETITREPPAKKKKTAREQQRQAFDDVSPVEQQRQAFDDVSPKASSETLGSCDPVAETSIFTTPVRSLREHDGGLPAGISPSASNLPPDFANTLVNVKILIKVPEAVFTMWIQTIFMLWGEEFFKNNVYLMRNDFEWTIDGFDKIMLQKSICICTNTNRFFRGGRTDFDLIIVDECQTCLKFKTAVTDWHNTAEKSDMVLFASADTTILEKFTHQFVIQSKISDNIVNRPMLTAQNLFNIDEPVLKIRTYKNEAVNYLEKIFTNNAAMGQTYVNFLQICDYAVICRVLANLKKRCVLSLVTILRKFEIYLLAEKKEDLTTFAKNLTCHKVLCEISNKPSVRSLREHDGELPVGISPGLADEDNDAVRSRREHDGEFGESTKHIVSEILSEELKFFLRDHVKYPSRQDWISFLNCETDTSIFDKLELNQDFDDDDNDDDDDDSTCDHFNISGDSQSLRSLPFDGNQENFIDEIVRLRVQCAQNALSVIKKQQKSVKAIKRTLLLQRKKYIAAFDKYLNIYKSILTNSCGVCLGENRFVFYLDCCSRRQVLCFECRRRLELNNCPTCPFCRASLPPLPKTSKNEQQRKVLDDVQKKHADYDDCDDESSFQNVFFKTIDDIVQERIVLKKELDFKILIVFDTKLSIRDSIIRGLSNELKKTFTNYKCLLFDKKINDLNSGLFTFRTDDAAKFAFINTTAFNFGINMEFASDIVILNTILDKSTEKQIIGRVLRPGQTKQVNVYKLVYQN